MRVLGWFFLFSTIVAPAASKELPNFILVMTDDQGWGQTGYYGHPCLKTPHLDEMAANGLRMDRFYSGASNCSPTRATVLTGRTNDRTGVQNHGYPLRLQEKTIAQVLKDSGYSTGHFGKWHLNGLRGPGVPVLRDDTHSPGAFGFDHWLTATNYIDRDPLLSRMGTFESFKGDSSEVSVAEAVEFIDQNKESPLFVVIWFGSPHSPMIASKEDRVPFSHLGEEAQHHLGELVAMDRSIGLLRKGVRDAGIAENTLIWFNSDNGGLANVGPSPMGGLRGSKNTMFEGGIRVPCVIEWPAAIAPGRVSKFPSGTVDIFPTLAEAAGLDPESTLLKPYDGISLVKLFKEDLSTREKPLGFRHTNRGVWIDNDYKYLNQNGNEELYHLVDDPAEKVNLAQTAVERFDRMRAEYAEWNQTVEASVNGMDYETGQVDPDQPERRFWVSDPEYQMFLDQFKERPEYRNWIDRHQKKQKQ